MPKILTKDIRARWLDHKSVAEFVNRRSSKPIFATLNHRWMIVPLGDFLDYRLAELKNTLEEFSGGAGSDVVTELGSGWGRNIFSLKSVGFDRELRGIELTAAGVKAADQISKHFGVEDVSFRQGNLLEDDFYAENQIIYTNHCLEQIKYGTESVLRRIASQRPRRVVHFEPVIELSSPFSARDIVNRLYNRIARYQSSLLSTLRKLEKEGVVKILHVSREGYYQLPIQETCCIVWEPTN